MILLGIKLIRRWWLYKKRRISYVKIKIDYYSYVGFQRNYIKVLRKRKKKIKLMTKKVLYFYLFFLELIKLK